MVTNFPHNTHRLFQPVTWISIFLLPMLWQCTYSVPEGLTSDIQNASWQFSRTSAPADGFSTIQAKILFTNKANQPVPNLPVQFVRNTIALPSAMQSDSEGVVELELTSATTEQVQLEAIVTFQDGRKVRLITDTMLSFVAGLPRIQLQNPSMTMTAGQIVPFQLTIQADDGNGLPAFPCELSGSLLSQDSNSNLPAGASLLADANGILSSTIQLTLAGNNTLSLACRNWPEMAAVDLSLQVDADKPSQVVVRNFQGSSSLEASTNQHQFTFTLEAKDSFNNTSNLLPADTSLSVLDSNQTTIVPPIALNWQQGVVDVSIDSNRFVTVGTVQLSVIHNDGVLPIVPAILTTIVTAPASNLAFIDFTGDANNWLDINLKITDSFANPIPVLAGSLILSSDCPGADIAPIPSIVTDANGSIQLPAAYRCSQPGDYTIYASFQPEQSSKSLEASQSHRIGSDKPYFVLALADNPVLAGQAFTLQASLFDSNQMALLQPNPVLTNLSYQDGNNWVQVSEQNAMLDTNNTFAIHVPATTLIRTGDVLLRLENDAQTIVGLLTVTIQAAATSTLELSVENSASLLACRPFALSVRAKDTYGNASTLPNADKVLLSIYGGGAIDGALLIHSGLSQQQDALIGQFAISRPSQLEYLLIARAVDSNMVSNSVTVSVPDSSIQQNNAIANIRAIGSTVVININDLCTAKVALAISGQGKPEQAVIPAPKISDFFQGGGWLNALGKQQLTIPYSFAATMGDVPNGTYTMRVLIETALDPTPVERTISIAIKDNEPVVNDWQMTSNSISGHQTIFGDYNKDGLAELYLIPDAVIDANFSIPTQLTDIQPQTFAQKSFPLPATMIADGLSRQTTLVADMNNDGILDMTACYEESIPRAGSNGLLAVHVGNPNSNSLDYKYQMTMNRDEQCIGLVHAYLDSGPFAELLVHTNQRLFLLPNVGKDTTSPTPITIPSGSFALQSLVVAAYPIVGHGTSDLVLIDTMQPRIAIYTQRDETGFTSQPIDFDLSPYLSSISQIQWVQPPTAGLLKTFPSLLVAGEPASGGGPSQVHLVQVDLRPASVADPIIPLPEGKAPFVARWHTGTSKLMLVAAPGSNGATNPQHIQTVLVPNLTNPAARHPLLWLASSQSANGKNTIAAIQNSQCSIAKLDFPTIPDGFLAGTSLLPQFKINQPSEQILIDFDQDGRADILQATPGQGPSLYLGYDGTHFIQDGTHIFSNPSEEPTTNAAALLAIDIYGTGSAMPIKIALSSNESIINYWPLVANSNNPISNQLLKLPLPQQRRADDSNLLLAAVPAPYGRYNLWMAYSGNSGTVLAKLESSTSVPSWVEKVFTIPPGPQPVALTSQDINGDGIADLQLTTKGGAYQQITAWLNQPQEMVLADTPWLTYTDSSAIGTMLIGSDPSDNNIPNIWLIDSYSMLIGQEWSNNQWNLLSSTPIAFNCSNGSPKQLTWFANPTSRGIAASCQQSEEINYLWLLPDITNLSQYYFASAPNNIHSLRALDMTGEGCDEIVMAGQNGLGVWRGHCNGQQWQSLVAPSLVDSGTVLSQDVLVTGIQNVPEPQLVTLSGTLSDPATPQSYQRARNSEQWSAPYDFINAPSPRSRVPYANLGERIDHRQSFILADDRTMISWSGIDGQVTIVGVPNAPLSDSISQLEPVHWSHHDQPMLAVLQKNALNNIRLSFFSTTAQGIISPLSSLGQIDLGTDQKYALVAADTDGDGRQELLYYASNTSRISRIVFKGMNQPQITANWLLLSSTVQDLRMIAKDVDLDGQVELLLAYRQNGAIKFSLFRRSKFSSNWQEQAYAFPFGLTDRPMGLGVLNQQRSAGLSVLIVTSKHLVQIQLPTGASTSLTSNQVLLYPLLQQLEGDLPVRPAIMDVDFNGSPDVLLGIGRTFSNSGGNIIAWLPAQNWSNAPTP